MLRISLRKAHFSLCSKDCYSFAITKSDLLVLWEFKQMISTKNNKQN